MKQTVLVFLLLSISNALCAQTQPTELNIDMVKVSPNNCKVLLENDQVRVVQYTLKPGAKDNPHTHPAKASYILSGGKIRVYPEGKAPIEFNEVTGDSYWGEYAGVHFVENIGKTTYSALLTEVKQPISNTKSDEEAVQQTVIKMFDALSHRDAASVRSYCTTAAMFYEYGQAWTVDTLINKAITKNTAVDFTRTNKLEFVSKVIQGNVAWATYNLQSDINQNGKSVSVHWLESVVLVQEKKQWKINVLHSTRLK